MIILYDCLLSTSGETVINVLMIMVIVSPLQLVGEGPGVRALFAMQPVNIL
jgi:hypothetical protein